MANQNEQHEHAEIPKAKIRVLGIGGGGGNAVNSMVDSDLEGVQFIVANTDAQAVYASPVEAKVQLGVKITKGLGAGSNPDIGRRAAEEDLESIIDHIADSDILFLTAGLGGGTGSGATPIIAQAARELGILTVAVVTKPFQFEGKRRQQQAEEAIERLRKEVDTLIVIPNQKLLEVASPTISVLDAFAMANDVLKQAIKGVSDIIIRPGHINVDFADVKAIMKGMGMAIMGTGHAQGEDRARQAALNAINSPLIEDVSIEGARGVLINITGNCNLGLHEISEAANIVYERASDDATIILGSVINPEFGDEIMVTIIATGFDAESAKKKVVTIPATKIVEKKNNDLPPTQKQPKQNVPSVELQQEHHEEPLPAETVMSSSAETTELHVEPQPSDEEKKTVSSFDHISVLVHQEKNVQNLQPSALEIDLNDLDTPTFIRKKAEKDKAGKESGQ